MRPDFRRGALFMLGLLLMAAVAASPASAGSQVVTGEDEHCGPPQTGDPRPPICDFTRKVIQYARAGAPDPTKPILAIDCGGAGGVGYITAAYDDPDPDIVVVSPSACDSASADAVSTADYATTAFTTANFSAIVVGAGDAEDGRLNARKADFQAFFDQGGGIATFDSADADEDLDFLPLDVTLLNDSPNQRYTVTPDGSAGLGITDDEINGGPPGEDDCCRHELYEQPQAGSPLKVGALDAGSEVEGEGLVADGPGALQVAPRGPTPMVLFARVDPIPPRSASSGCLNATQVRITVTDEPNGSGPAAVRYTIDGGAEQTAATDASGNADISVSSGQHTVVFRGVDKAGNVETNANSVTVTCTAPPQQAAAPRDTTRPRASVAGVRSSCVRRAFRIRLTAADGGGIRRVVAKRDGRHLVNRAFSAATTRTSFTVLVRVEGLRAGRHTLAVAARDTSGNRITFNRTFRVCAAQRPAPAFTG